MSRIILITLMFYLFNLNLFIAQFDYGVDVSIGLAKQCSENNRDFMNGSGFTPSLTKGCTNYDNIDYRIGAYGSYSIYSNKWLNIKPSISLNYQYINFNSVDLVDINTAKIDGVRYPIPRFTPDRKIVTFNLPVYFISSDIEMLIELLNQFQLYGGYHLRYVVKKSYIPEFTPINTFLKKRGYNNNYLDALYFGIGYRYKRVSFLYRLLPINDPFSYIYETDLNKVLNNENDNFLNRPEGPMRYAFNRSHEFGIKVSLGKIHTEKLIQP